MTTLSDAAIQAAEEAYDEMIRREGTRSPYLNTRAFRAAFDAAIATEAHRAETPKSGSVHEGAGPKDIAQDIGGPSQ